MTAKIEGFVTRADASLRKPRSVSKNITPKAGGVAIHYGGANQSCAEVGAAHTECVKTWRGYQNYHMNKHGWVDVAYTGAFCNHGYAFAGRGKGVRTAAQGTSAGNQNFYAVVWLGGGNQVPTKQAYDALEWWIVTLRSSGAGDAVKPHNYFKPTSCPGKPLRAQAMLVDGKDFPSKWESPTPAPKPPPSSGTWQDKIVVAKENVNFYTSPGWAPQNRPAGVLKKGWGFRGGIHRKERVGGGYQYLVSNSNGFRVWITANERYISLKPKR